MGAVLAVLAAVAVSFAVNASADPAGLAIEGDNGRRTQRITHPDNAGWYVDIAVDTHRGLLTDSTDNYVSGAATISRGPGVRRVQIDAIRVAFSTTIYNDYYPSKTSSARDNTRPGCAIGANLYADVSTEVGCQPGPNRLNSDADYAGNVVTVRGYSDWLGPATCGTEQTATRGFFAVRWNDNSYSTFTLRSDNVQLNPEC